MGDDIRGAGRRVIADIVDRAGPPPGDRGAQHGGEVIDMDAREDLPRLVDTARHAGAQRVERAAARSVNAGEAKDMHRHAAIAA